MNERRHWTVVALSLWVLFVALLIADVDGARASPESFSFPAQGRNVLPVDLGKQLLHPCSRAAPKLVASYWEPSPAEIDDLENGLLSYIDSIARAGKALPPSGAYDRQIIGIVWKGKRLVYVSFFPTGFRQYDPAHEVIDVCDGGPKLWGLVYDPKHATYSDLSFSTLGG